MEQHAKKPKEGPLIPLVDVTTAVFVHGELFHGHLLALPDALKHLSIAALAQGLLKKTTGNERRALRAEEG